MTNFANRKTSRRLRMCRLRRARLSAAGDKGPRGTVHRVFCRNFFFIVVSENVRVILRRDLLSVKNVAENYNTTFFFISTEQLQNRRGKSFERYCYAKFVRFFFFVRYVFILRQRVRRKLPYTINGSRLFRTTTACVSRRVCAIKRVYFFNRSTVRKKRRALARTTFYPAGTRIRPRIFRTKCTDESVESDRWPGARPRVVLPKYVVGVRLRFNADLKIRAHRRDVHAATGFFRFQRVSVRKY